MKEKLTIEQIETILIRVESHDRTDKLKEIIDQLDRKGRKAAILFTWSGTQAPSMDWEFWEDWLPYGLYGVAYTDNQSAFDALPEELTIYRGSGSEFTATDGFSWTLDKKIAAKFAKMTTLSIGSSMVSRKQPGFIATAKIPKSMVSMYITGREESEVVVLPDHWPDDCTLEPV